MHEAIRPSGCILFCARLLATIQLVLLGKFSSVTDTILLELLCHLYLYDMLIIL